MLIRKTFRSARVGRSRTRPSDHQILQINHMRKRPSRSRFGKIVIMNGGELLWLDRAHGAMIKWPMPPRADLGGIYQFFQFLSRLEIGNAFSGNIDGGTRFRISPFSGISFANTKTSKTSELDLFKRLGSRFIWFGLGSLRGPTFSRGFLSRLGNRLCVRGGNRSRIF